MLGGFEQGIANVLHGFRLTFFRRGLAFSGAARFALGQAFVLSASVGPGLPANLIQCVSGPGNHVERVHAPLGIGAVFLHTRGNPPGAGGACGTDGGKDCCG